MQLTFPRLFKNAWLQGSEILKSEAYCMYAAATKG
jgi:hypothetical protein